MDDSTLVQRAVDGDKDAFAAIYDQYAPRLQAFLWWVLQDGERATAVLADTFRIAGSRLHQLADPTRLRPWLYAIAAHEALAAAPTLPAVPEDGPPTRDEAGGEFIDVVRTGAQELSPRDRALLDLRFRQRLRNQDLADALGVKPESAEATAQRVADRTEHLLGPTLAIRFSTNNCPDLMAIVGTNLGPLDSRTRRKAEEHVDRCPTCDNWRRRITASTVLSASPTPAPPPELRQQVLDEVQLAAYDGRPWPRRRNGFPPPLVSEHQDERLRRAVMAAAAAVIVGVVLVGALVLASNDKGGQQVASVGSSTTSSTRPRAPSTVLTTLPLTSTSAVPGSIGGVTGGAAPASGAGGGGDTTAAGTGRSITTQQTDTVTPASPGTTEPPVEDTETTTTTEAPPPPPPTVPDREGPTLSGLTVTPSTLGCGRTATVTVQASDPSGIASVAAVPGLPGGQRVAMSGGGGTYTATVGPFASGLPLGQDLNSRVVVQAVDTLGNESAASAPITLSCTSG